jgi:acyl carrier protein phosphodiesterase
MNFLAHFHLAWPEDGLLAGALEGDYHKGPISDELSADLARGVRLHRAIDAYTDNHPAIAALRREFPAELRRYAGILIDLSFDHYLSRHWQRYAGLHLDDFNHQVLTRLEARSSGLSSGSQRMLGRLREHDLLNRYHDWSTVTASAERIGERFRRGNPLGGTARGLEPLRGRLETTFLVFYPELQAFTGDWRER